MARLNLSPLNRLGGLLQPGQVRAAVDAQVCNVHAGSALVAGR